VYGQLFDPDFVFRTLTQLGGLLLLLRHEDVIARGARGRSTSDALGGLSAGAALPFLYFKKELACCMSV
jgi:hypothetical protein